MKNNTFYSIFVLLSVLIHGYIFYFIKIETEKKTYEDLSIDILNIEPQVKEEASEQKKEISQTEKKESKPIEPKKIEKSNKSKSFEKKIQENLDVADNKNVEEKPKKIIDQRAILSQVDQYLYDKNQYKNTREKTISNKTKEPLYRDYYAVWQEKIERIGRLNFPAIARKDKSFGVIVMTVSLRSDGSISQIEIHKSSGLEELDAAARNIVKVAEPFAEFPVEMKKNIDTLHIKRVWRFDKGDNILE